MPASPMGCASTRSVSLSLLFFAHHQRSWRQMRTQLTRWAAGVSKVRRRVRRGRFALASSVLQKLCRRTSPPPAALHSTHKVSFLPTHSACHTHTYTHTCSPSQCARIHVRDTGKLFFSHSPSFHPSSLPPTLPPSLPPTLLSQPLTHSN